VAVTAAWEGVELDGMHTFEPVPRTPLPLPTTLKLSVAALLRKLEVVPVAEYTSKLKAAGICTADAIYCATAIELQAAGVPKP
jgi:hypothetical protein